MRWLTSTATRILPVAFLAMALIALAQFWIQYGPGKDKMVSFLDGIAVYSGNHTWPMAALASVFWLITFAGYFHERQRRFSLHHKQKSMVMDILDRLTNRKVLEKKLAEQPDAIFIDAAKLAAALKEKIIGQDIVCDDIAAQIRRRLALKQRGKPVGVFILAGPPGTGKTYLAKCLANELQRPLCHLDMTQFSRGGHAATQLFGSSKGYAGSDTYGKLTAALRDTPDAVVLLDEIEKAHSEVHKNFLTAWNDGFITESSDGRQISTTEAIFILTTNAATDTLEALSKTYANDPDELRRSSTNALHEAGFASEVLNRIDRIFVFRSLSGLDIARVTALEIEVMVKGYGLDVAPGGIDPQVLLDMMLRQQRLGTAASSRDLVRAVEESIADILIQAKQNGHVRVALESVDGTVVASAKA